MKRVFVFDVDGTLTPARQRMKASFIGFFQSFCAQNKVYLVTGSDYEKVLEQVPECILNLVEGIFTCSGNQYWEKGSIVYNNGFEPPQDLFAFLNRCLLKTSYKNKTGNHIEVRPGTINFSVVGRNCTDRERKAYSVWDRMTGERKMIRNELIFLFPTIDCVIGGEISVDIYPVGCDKAQSILFIKDRDPDCSIVFYGDKLTPGGNDYPVYSVLDENTQDLAVCVEGWEQTKDHLQEHCHGRGS